MAHLGQPVPYAIQVLLERVGQVLQGCRADVVSNHKEEERLVLVRARMARLARLEQAQVYLEHRLEQAHVGALEEADLVLPHVDDEDLGARHAEQRGLALKVLGVRAADVAGHQPAPSSSRRGTCMDSPGPLLAPARPCLRRP